jgi:hypothetical protein
MFWPWSRRLDGRLFVMLAGSAVIGTVMAGSDQGQHVCSVADPCLPSQFGSTALGLLLGSMIAVYLHRRAAAWLAVATVITFVIADSLDPTMPWWVYVVFIGYVAACWHLPGTERQPAGSAVAAVVTDHRPVPRPARVPTLGRFWLGTAAVLAAGTVASVWWGFAAQGRKDAQQQAAPVVTAIVQAHRDEFTAHVVLFDGRYIDVSVLDATDYPVGASMALGSPVVQIGAGPFVHSVKAGWQAPART